MTEYRAVIVNADDLGRTEGINRGIFTAHEYGIVTSASLMVRWPTAADAVAQLHRFPTLSVGLHVDLAEWDYQFGEWVCSYEVVQSNDAGAVTQEIERQIATFERLTGRLPTHLDSHQHVHQNDPSRSCFQRVANALGVPLRDVSGSILYCGEFYGQTGKGSPLPDFVSPAHLIDILKRLPLGITELGCHPGYPSEVSGSYQDERVREVETLCHTDVREALSALEIRLCSFADYLNIG